MAARLTRSGPSGSKPECCRAHTEARSSPAARPRHWLQPRWTPATTCNAWRVSKGKRKNASCFTITFRRFLLEKWHFCVAPDDEKLGTERWRKELSRPYCQL